MGYDINIELISDKVMK